MPPAQYARTGAQGHHTTIVTEYNGVAVLVRTYHHFPFPTQGTFLRVPTRIKE